MQTARKQWLEFAGAVTLLGLSAGLVLAQGGSPPPVPLCLKCRPSPERCEETVIAAADCCCCYNGYVWDCKAQNAVFSCVAPPFPWSQCFQAL